MHFSLISLFPDFFSGPLSQGLMGRALSRGLLSYSVHNPRDYSLDKHHKVDDRPYGGGPGMVLLAEPLAACLDEVLNPAKGEGRQVPRLIGLSPKGRPLSQSLVRELAREKHLALLCGRYEGLDQRIESLYPVENISLGDFILNGGESAALCLLEALARLQPGFMGADESCTEESFSDGLLEYPHYTRPVDFQGLSVPAVLRSGDHAAIQTWRRKKSLEATLELRPDLLAEAALEPDDYPLLQELPRRRLGKNLSCALLHYPVLDKWQNSAAVSLTNLDIHDIARSSCTYGLAAYYLVTPLEDQLRLLESILTHWREGTGQASNPSRGEALRLVKGARNLDEVIEAVREESGTEPFLLGSSARLKTPARVISCAAVREILEQRAVLLLLGTGHGLAPELARRCEAFLPPIRPLGAYNHLPVRAAAALFMDRILGDWF